MMLLHPVLLGSVWLLLVISASGQSQISNNESNKVYAYSYHFQHNGTTNSKDILRSVLGNDPDFGLDNPDEKSIVKTFSSPGIRGFFTKGVLPAGPISQSFSNGVSSPYTTIRKIVESNLQPPTDIATGLLPPISPDISRQFPGDFNSVNHIGNVFKNQDDFPKIPSPPRPVIPNNVGNRKVENFARDTPDGGRIVGRVETFSYNSPQDVNSISRTEENSEGYRRNENILNNNREVTGHRTQSFFRTNFRTITPNLESNNYNENSRVASRNTAVNNNNQWWNVLNVLGNKNSNLNPTSPQANKDINQNIKDIENNINRAFGTRLSGFRRQNVQHNLGQQSNDNYHNRNHNFNNPIANQNFDKPLLNQNFNNPLTNQNFNNPLANQNFNNPLLNNHGINIPFSRSDVGNNQHDINNNNNYRNVPNSVFNNPINTIANQNHHTPNNAFSNNLNINHNNNPNINRNNNHNINTNVNTHLNDDTEKKVLNLINDVSAHLKEIQNNNQRVNNIGPTWDDDVSRNIHNDWSTRRRPFSNGHSGPSNSPQPVDILKTTFDALAGNRNINIPPNQGNNYRNVDGGGVEKFFGFDKVVEGPNSFSRNHQRGYERDFQVNSNSGYSRSNQWSSNTVRRLDAQSSKPDFSTDFIDVFRDDY